MLVDQYFLRDYVPRVARFLDGKGDETQLWAYVACVETQKTCERIPLKSYLSEEYFMGIILV